MKLLVLVARGLQASLVGTYGNHWVMTPALDALAARGILFDSCYADADARRSWRTGRLNASAPGDLLALLRAADVPTMLVHDVSRPLPEHSLQGWSATVEVDPTADEDPLELALQGTEELLEAMREEANALVWVDLPTALPPWNIPPDFVAPYFEDTFIDEEIAEEDEEDEEDDVIVQEEAPELFEDDEPPPVFMPQPTGDRLAANDDHQYLSLRCSYAAAVSYLDAGIGHLLEALDRIDPEQEIAVVFTSDRGFPLGEHGTIGTVGAGPHEELLHVPLIVRLPKHARAGRREPGLCQSIDLAVTLANLFGVMLPEPHGRDLLSSEAPETLLCTSGDRHALRTEEWSYVTQPGELGKLYRQPDDAWETNDVRHHHQELAEHFERIVAAMVAAIEQPGPLVRPDLAEPEA